MENQKLSELDDWQLKEDDQDVRGQALMMTSGERLGTIRDMVVDLDGERVSAVVLEDGRMFPVEDLELHDDYVITHDSNAGDRSKRRLYQARLVRMSNRQPI